MRVFILLLTFMASGLVSSSATAEVGTPSLKADQGAPRFGFGARVGGYGFRAAEGDGLTWFDCRMDGVGLLGTLDLGPHFFVETSVDFYQATPGVVREGMDRVSVLSLGALGFRMLPTRFFSPLIQLGGGAELTRITMEGHRDVSQWAPVAFLGFGGEFNFTERLKVGVGLRFLSMLHPEHDHSGEDHDHGSQTFFPESEGPRDMTTSFAPAAQGVGYLRYLL